MFHEAFVSMEGWCTHNITMFCGFYAALKDLENTHNMFNGINDGFVSGFFDFYGLIQLFFVSGSNTCTDCVYYNNPGFTFNVCLYQINKNIVH